MFTVDLDELPVLAHVLSMYRTGVRLLLQEAKKFYGMTHIHRNRPTQLNLYNLYPNYPEFMEYIRYYNQALLNSIMDQIQGETGRHAEEARRAIREIRQLLQTSEDELYKPDEDGSEDEDEEDDEEPIYFTTKGVVDEVQQNLKAWHKHQERELDWLCEPEEKDCRHNQGR